MALVTRSVTLNLADLTRWLRTGRTDRDARLPEKFRPVFVRTKCGIGCRPEKR